MTKYSKHRLFAGSSLQAFLKSGWMLSVQSHPDHILVGWGEMETSSEPSEVALYAPDFRLLDPKPWRVTEFWDLLDRKTFATHVMSGVDSNVNVEEQAFQWVEPSYALFEERFSIIQKGLESGHLLKAVPVVFAEAQAKVSALRRGQILRSLVSLPSHLFIYGFWNDADPSGTLGEGILGATPELLFSLSSESEAQSQLETVALAGTRAKLPQATPRSNLQADELLYDPKERREHQIVIDDIASVLRPLGEVVVGVTATVELPTLYHLKTAIAVHLKKPLGLQEAAGLLHPTPALGVAPRRLGFAEMARWDDPRFRWRFGAPFGAIAPGIRDCVVAIRNIQWQGAEVRLGSGCGVVAESVLEREWQELELKRNSVKRLLGV